MNIRIAKLNNSVFNVVIKKVPDISRIKTGIIKNYFIFILVFLLRNGIIENSLKIVVVDWIEPDTFLPKVGNYDCLFFHVGLTSVVVKGTTNYSSFIEDL